MALSIGYVVTVSQANLSITASVVQPQFSLAVLTWLATYVLLLFAWAVTSTRTTMHARVTFGRSKLVRWISAIVGLVAFVGIPMGVPRLLLPSGVLLAIAPIIYSIYGVYKKGGVPLGRAVQVGTVSSVMIAYASVFRFVTLIVEMVWIVFQAIVQFDWATLRDLPEKMRQAKRKVQQMVAPDSARFVTLLADSGLPLDTETDPRLNGIPKSVLGRLESLLNQGLELGASNTSLTIRREAMAETAFRVDGITHRGPALSGQEGALVARTIKKLAGLPVVGQSAPLAGSFPVMWTGRRSNMLVETASSNGVDTVLLRSTVEERVLIDDGLAGLGMDDAAVAAVRDLLRLDRGLILFAGLPYSGKSTTMYAAMVELGLLGRSVALVEKSIRHHLDHVAQIAASGSGTSTFPAAIQAAIQHRPEVLVVRDILDRQTADACAREAAAGRLVLAGVNGDDAIDGLQRLRSIGVDSGMLSVGLKGLVAQRLVRVLCESCKVSYEASPELVMKLKLPKAGPNQLYRAVGCPQCRGTGFKGQTGLFEVLAVDEPVAAAIASNEPFDVLEKALRNCSLRSRKQSAVGNIRQGITSVEEVIRVMK